MTLDQKAEPGSDQVWLVATVTNAGAASAAGHTLIMVTPPGVVPVKNKTDHRCDLTHADAGEIKCVGPALEPGASEVYRVLARGAAQSGNSGSVSAVAIPAPDHAEAVPSDNVVTQPYVNQSALAASPWIETYFDDPRTVV